MKHRHILLLLALLATVVTTRAQDRWAAIADTLMRYAPTSVYLFNDSVRQWLLDYERAEGYPACYQRFYDTICQNIERAKQQGDEDAVRETTLCRLYMSWQQGNMDTDEAHRQIQQLVADDCKEHGDTTAQHVRLVAIMANFLCEAGRYAEAERWCLHIDTLLDCGVPVYIWHNSFKLLTSMVAQAGQGRLMDAWHTAIDIEDRYNDESVKSIYLNRDGNGLRRLKPMSKSLATLKQLAPQLLLPLLPLPPSHFVTHTIAPWPFSQTISIVSLRQLPMLSVFSLHDLMLRANLSSDFTTTMLTEADRISKCIYDYENYDSIAPPLSAELCRRTAIMASIEAARCDTIHYPHNTEKNKVMTHWRRCMAQEQLNYDEERSATALLYFSGEWIKKGYPLSLLPLVKEAVAAMRRELGDERPTQRQLLLAAQDRQWLAKELPAFRQLTEQVPEYASVLAALNQLAESQQGR